MTRDELEALKIQAPSEEIRKQVKAEWDRLAKPLDGMGEFEELTARMGAVIGCSRFSIEKKAVIVWCADNGIVREGVSQSGQEVTLSVASAMGRQQSSVGIMAKSVGADVIPVDIGINHSEKLQGVLDRKIALGTRNFRMEPAMTEQETLAAIQAGIDMAAYCKEKGYHLLAAGEMGIGNTTCAGAMAAALTGCGVSEITGRGAGLSDSGLERKRRLIGEALEKYQFRKEETFRILRTVGGLDIAGMTGLFIGGALYHIPVVMDGMISVTAALTAERLKPGVRDFLLPSHMSREPAAEYILKELGIHAVLDASLALGEGTGAVMMFALLDIAMALYNGGTCFSDIGMEQYQRIC